MSLEAYPEVCVVLCTVSNMCIHNHHLLIFKINILSKLWRASPASSLVAVRHRFMLLTEYLSLDVTGTCLLSLRLFSSQLSLCPSLFPSLSLTFTQSLQSYWPWFLLICIHHFSFFGIWHWGTFPSLSEFTAISLCVFSKGLGYEMHIKYPLIPHYPTDKITMIMRQKF